MKRLSVILVLAVSALLCSCSCDSGAGQSDTGQSEQMSNPLPDVEEAARGHARRLHPDAYRDSLQLHALLLDAAATRSLYELAGQNDKADRFNKVFLDELRSVNPTLAASLQQ